MRRYWGGGSILAAAADSSFCVRRPGTSVDAFEAGTPHFAGILGEPSVFRLEMDRLIGVCVLSEQL
jgi:hypothetical protein